MTDAMARTELVGQKGRLEWTPSRMRQPTLRVAFVLSARRRQWVCVVKWATKVIPGQKEETVAQVLRVYAANQE